MAPWVELGSLRLEQGPAWPGAQQNRPSPMTVGGAQQWQDFSSHTTAPASPPPAWQPGHTGPAQPYREGVGVRGPPLLQKAGNKRELFVVSPFLNMVFIEAVLASLIG